MTARWKVRYRERGRGLLPSQVLVIIKEKENIQTSWDCVNATTVSFIYLFQRENKLWCGGSENYNITIIEFSVATS